MSDSKTRRAPEGRFHFGEALVRRIEVHVGHDRTLDQLGSGEFFRVSHFMFELLEVMVRLPRIPYRHLEEMIDRLELFLPRKIGPRDNKTKKRLVQVIRRLAQYEREWGSYPRAPLAMVNAAELMLLELGPKDHIVSIEIPIEVIMKQLRRYIKHHGIHEKISNLIFERLEVCRQLASDEPRIQYQIYLAMCAVTGKKPDPNEDP
jgi:hypothetical protein